MINRNIFLLLGGNKLNYGIYQKFKNKNMLVYVVDWNEKPDIVGDKHYRLDVKDGKSIARALEKDGVINDVIFAYSSIDLAVEAVAYLNKLFGYKTLNDHGVANASSKSMMTKKWNEAGLLNRFSRAYSSYDSSILEQNKHVSLIFKPDNSSSSRGITICPKADDEANLYNAFIKASTESSNGLVIVEEFVIGTEFTVEMLGDSNSNVSVYGISKKSHTPYNKNNKIAVKLHYNSISDSLQNKIANYAIQCYQALNFSSSLGHLEILLKEDGTLSPIEIGARSSGFIASDLVDIVSGRDYLMDLLDVYKGGLVFHGLLPQTNFSSMYYFYDFPNNFTIKKQCSLLDFCDKNIVSLYSDHSSLKSGVCFNIIDNDNARVGFEILKGDKSILTKDYIDLLEKKMLMEMGG